MLKRAIKHILFYSSLTILLFACTNDLKDVMAIPTSKLSPSRTADTISLVYTDSAMLKVVVKAGHLVQFDRNVSEPFTILSNGVNVTFFDENEKVSSTLKCKTATHYELRDHMEARNGVVVVNAKGERLETEKLTWDKATHRIYTKEMITITTPTQKIIGKGLESNENFSRYSIKNIVATMQLESDEL
jgi:LPS export ABC transporter protein LptC